MSVGLASLMEKLLLIDDEADVQYSFRRIFDASDIELHTASSGEEGLRLIPRVKPDLVLSDIRMAGLNGLETLRRIRQLDPQLPVILMTAYGTTQTAIEAMKLGAYDYVSKPFMSDEILLTLRKAAERERLRSENAFLRSEVEKAAGPELIYASESMGEVVRLVGKVRDYDATVLVTGERGTGKELVARLLHFGGRRKGKPFIAVNCGAIPETLLESEMFGYKKGAFSEAKTDRAGLIEEAEGGTLFLDEIGELPMALQTKMLRFLQEGEIRRLGDNDIRKVRVRVVAATSRELEKDALEGRFREDLLDRINIVRVHIPPLRERRQDIPLLSRKLLTHYCNKYGKKEIRISEDAAESLALHEWPGNVRELKNMMDRCAMLCTGVELSRDEMLKIWWMAGGGAQGKGETSPSLTIRIHVSSERPDLKAAVRELERQLIRIALERTGGSRPKAAELLGISHPTLLYKTKEFGIEPG